MSDEQSYAPVIIIGMHRSGTSLVTRILDQLGLFVGTRLDSNHESVFFHRINLWILNQCGTQWDYPAPVVEVLKDNHARQQMVDYIKSVINNPLLAVYLGMNKYLRYRNLSNLNMPWGWKDPVTTYTLPLWLDVFPNAKVIHVYRHGVDVANSIKVREEKLARERSLLFYKRLHHPFFWVTPRWHRYRYIRSSRCMNSLEGGFSLWEAYMEQAQLITTDLGARALDVRYEDFLDEPTRYCERLADFCGISAHR